VCLPGEDFQFGEHPSPNEQWHWKTHHKQNIVKLNISHDKTPNEIIAKAFRLGQIRLKGFAL
jgi:hypothetical protein